MSDFSGQISYYNLPSDTEGEPASTESAKAAPKPSGESDIKSAEAPDANKSEAAKPAAPVSDPEKSSKQAVDSASESVQSVVTKSDEKPVEKPVKKPVEEKPTEADVKSELSAAKSPAPDKMKSPEPSAGLDTNSIFFCFLFAKPH